MTADAEVIAGTHQTGCCVVGAGPAGMMLALLMARKDVPVTLLEAHHDFDRDFRGDTIHPSLVPRAARVRITARLSS